MKSFLSFLVKYQLRLQSTFLWILAVVNITSDAFWVFAIPAIIAGGMQDILNEVRKIKENGERPEIF